MPNKYLFPILGIIFAFTGWRIAETGIFHQHGAFPAFPWAGKATMLVGIFIAVISIWQLLRGKKGSGDDE